VTPSKPRRAGRPSQPIPREDLLSLARSAFAEGGYAGTSMGAIADQAGLRKASLFHHFPTKQALYLEVLGAIAGDLGRLVLEAGLDRGDFLQRLDRLGILVEEYLGSHPDAARLLLRELIDRGPFLRGPGKEMVQMTMGLTARFLQDGMDRGEIPSQDPRQLAVSIAGLHLTWYATSEVTSAFIDEDVFAPAQVRRRTAEVLRQVRLLCGAPPLPAAHP
jgi:TetR/AcrR family transcriptional regulator